APSANNEWSRASARDLSSISPGSNHKSEIHFFGPPTPQRGLDSQRRERGQNNTAPFDRHQLTGARGVNKRLQFLIESFILRHTLRHFAISVRPGFKHSEIVQHGDAAAAVNLNSLFRKSAVAVRKVVDIADRPVAQF